MKSKRSMYIAIGAAAGLTLGVGIAIGVGALHDAPKEPEATTTSTPSEIPEEAKDFVNLYSNRYTDPLATYYAEKAYLQRGVGGIVIDQEYIDSYSFDSLKRGEISPLGFPMLKLDPDKEVTAENYVSFFNDSFPTLEYLINLLAKNPTSDQVAVIRDEFIKYSGVSNAQDAGKLVDTLREVAMTHGSSANYRINPITTDIKASNQNQSIYPGGRPAIDAVDNDGYITAFSSGIDLSIAIESFSNTGQKTNAVEILDYLQFNVVRAADYDPNNIGYVGIGIR